MTAGRTWEHLIGFTKPFQYGPNVEGSLRLEMFLAVSAIRWQLLEVSIDLLFHGPDDPSCAEIFDSTVRRSHDLRNSLGHRVRSGWIVED